MTATHSAGDRPADVEPVTTFHWSDDEAVVQRFDPQVFERPTLRLSAVDLATLQDLCTAAGLL